MYTILLVDDEFPARQLIKSMLDWEQTGFSIAYEAKNGADALRLYRAHRPDLIISDIQMPVMDGLELLSAIRQQDEAQLFIILSCYERFDYARQVIRLGGLDYLIKDTLTPEALHTALQQVREKLTPAPRPPAPSRLGDSPLLSSSCSAALCEWLHTGDDARAVQRIQALGGGLPYIMVLARAEAPARETGTETSLKEGLSLLPEFYSRCGCAEDPSGALLLFAPLPQEGDEDLYNVRYAFLRSVKTALEHGARAPVTLGVSAVHSAAGELPKARAESEDALRYRLFMGCGNILYFNPLQNASYAIQQRHLEMRIESLRHAMAADDLPAVKDELDKLYGTDLYGVMHLNYLEYLNSILWGILTEERMLRGPYSLPVDGAGQLTLDSISRLEHVDDMKAAFYSLFSSVLGSGRRTPGAEYSQRVRHIVQYISDNLQHDIGLDTIARQFQIHKTHLARVFKEETGVSLQEFIRQKRIETAKFLLMNSQYRVNEIVYKVGFNNPQNFYTLFTRYVGLTPKEFRNKYG